MKRRSILALAAIAIVAALLFSLFFPYQRMPELPMPKEDATIPDSWARAVNSSAEVREKVGSEFKVVGSGYIKDAGLLMLRSGDRYYIAQIKENKVTEIKEQKIGWKTWEDTIREYIGLKDARVVPRYTFSSSYGIFYSFVALASEKGYSVAMDENGTITDVDPIEPNAWLDIVRNDKETREKIGVGRWRLKSYDILSLNGQNSPSLDIEAGGKQHLVSIEPDGYVEYLEEFKINENMSWGQDQDPLEVAKNDERIKELIVGKEYVFGHPTFFTTSDASVSLNVEGRFYYITISDDKVASIVSQEDEWLSALQQEDLGIGNYKLLGSCCADIDAEPIAILFIESEGNVYRVFLNIGTSEVRCVEKMG